VISNWDQSFEYLLQSEGGFVNDPNDPGGMTNLGVTKAAWEKYVGHAVSEADMRGLTPDVVKPFYKKEYWDAVQADVLPVGIDYVCFDFAVNANPIRSILLLQRCVNVKDDGILGKQTLSAVTDAYSANKIALIERFSDEKEAFYHTRPTFPIYGRGWMNRIDIVENRAKIMV